MSPNIEVLSSNVQDICNVWEKKWEPKSGDSTISEKGLIADLQDLFLAMMQGGYIADVGISFAWITNDWYEITVSFIEDPVNQIYHHRAFDIKPYQADVDKLAAYRRAMKVIG